MWQGSERERERERDYWRNYLRLLCVFFFFFWWRTLGELFWKAAWYLTLPSSLKQPNAHYQQWPRKTNEPGQPILSLLMLGHSCCSNVSNLMSRWNSTVSLLWWHFDYSYIGEKKTKPLNIYINISYHCPCIVSPDPGPYTALITTALFPPSADLARYKSSAIVTAKV